MWKVPRSAFIHSQVVQELFSVKRRCHFGCLVVGCNTSRLCILHPGQRPQRGCNKSRQLLSGCSMYCIRWLLVCSLSGLARKAIFLLRSLSICRPVCPSVRLMNICLSVSQYCWIVESSSMTYYKHVCQKEIVQSDRHRSIRSYLATCLTSLYRKFILKLRSKDFYFEFSTNEMIILVFSIAFRDMIKITLLKESLNLNLDFR